MSIKIALIGGLDYPRTEANVEKNKLVFFSNIFLERIVHRLNRFICPDITLIFDDVFSGSILADGGKNISKINHVLAKLKCPYYVIPSENDPEDDFFCSHFKISTDYFEIKNTRFVFLNYGLRTYFQKQKIHQELYKLRKARFSFNGNIVCVHHIPFFLFQKYSFSNNHQGLDEIINAMRKNNVIISISNNFDNKLKGFQKGNISYMHPCSLYNPPFSFSEIYIDNQQTITTKTNKLKNPEKLYLHDYHIHTSMAYCNENMNMEKSIWLGKMFGLEKIAFSEHSGHLYFDKKSYNHAAYLTQCANHVILKDRTQQYFDTYEGIASHFTLLGMEIDAGYQGRPLIKKKHWKKLQIRIGAVHSLPNMHPGNEQSINNNFLFVNKELMRSGIEVLAHPFRVFRRAGLKTPEILFKTLCDLLKEYNVAAEINFHTNEPSPLFFKMCIENKVKVCFGSDAHNLYEVGEFYPHMEFLQKLEVDENYEKILFKIQN